MKKLVLYLAIFLMLFQSVLAVTSNAYFEGNGGSISITIEEGESTWFTATAFTMDPPVWGQVFMLKSGDNSFGYIFDTYTVTQGSYGSYYEDITIAPSSYNGCGDFTITVQAYDQNGGSDYTDIYLHVNCAPQNTAPSINLPDKTLQEDSGLNNNVLDLEDYASDAEENPSDLTYSIISESNRNVVDCAIDTSNNLDCTTQTNQNGYSDIVIRVSDSEGLTDSDTMRVTVSPVNDAPVVSGLPDISFVEDGSYTGLDLDNYVTDVDNTDAQMTWTYSGNSNVYVSIGAGNVVTFTAKANWHGSETLTFTATDPGSLSDSDSMIVTVTSVNDNPDVTNIPDVTFPEDGSDSSIDLDNYVSDLETADSNIQWSYSGSTNVYVSIDGNHIVTFTAKANWNGQETITFTATDANGASDSDAVLVTVTPVNDAPIVSNIPDVSFPEDGSDSSIDLDNYVSDIDNTDSQMTWTYTGNNHVHVSISSTSKVVTFTADANWHGSETLTFTATDPGSLSDSDTMTVTVTSVNDKPDVKNIPDVTFPEDGSDSSIDLDNYVTDDSTSDANIAWSYSGDNHVHVSINPSSRVVTFTADANWFGYEDITFTAEDSNGATDSDTMRVTVTPVNDAPIVSNIPDVSFPEDGSDSSIDLDNYVSDVDNTDAEIAWSYAGNNHVHVSISSTSKVVTFTADANWHGSETLTFTATDPGSLSDSDTMTVTVTSVNDKPDVKNIPDVTFPEDGSDSSIDLDNYVSDVETSDASIAWSYSGDNHVHVSINPTTRVVTFTADANWFGYEDITFTAEDSNGATDSDTMRVTVTPVNDAPIVSNIPDVSFPEDGSDSSIDLDNYVSDVDNTDAEIAWSYAGNNHVHVSISSTSKVVTFTADANWNGQETITFTAEDPSGLSDSDSMKVTVTSKNDAPVMSPLPDISFNEDESYTGLDLDNYVSDADHSDSQLSWSYTGNNHVHVSIDSNNIVTFTADANWHGYEDITFTVTDPTGLSDSDTMRITVISVNDLPEVCVPHVTFEEDGSETINLDNCVTDADHSASQMTWTYTGNTHVHVSISTSRIATFTADQDWTGQEILTFTATDPEGGSDSDDFIVTVTPVNDAPVVSGIPDVTFDEDGSDSSIDLDNYVSDVDNSDAEMTWTYSGNNHVHVSINPTTRVVTFTADADWTGQETLTFTATDPGSLSDSDSMIVTVVGCNDDPVISSIPDVTFNEDESYTGLDLDNYVSDTDDLDSELIWTYTGNNHVHISINSNHLVTFTADANWYGQEIVTFTVTDTEGGSDSDSILVKVLPVNDAPVVSGLPDISFNEDESYTGLDLDNFVSDIDNIDADMTWTYSGNTNIFVTIGAGNIVTFTAAPNWYGSETITFTAEDPDGLSDSDTMLVTVTPVNDDPYICVPHITFEEDGSATLDMDDCVADVDNQPSDMTWTYTGNTHVHVSIDTNRIATFTADQDWNGQETLTFTANDGDGGSNSDNMIVTVTPVNDAPVVSDIPDVIMDEDTTDSSIDLDDYVSDIDNTDAQMTWTYSGNSNIQVSINSNNIVSFTAPANWNGQETIVFTATDPGSLSDSDTMTVTVVGCNDDPVISSIPDVTFNEDESYTGLDLDNYVSDTDNTDAELTWTYTGNNHVHISINSNHVVTFTADANWYGQEIVTFTVTDLDGGSDSDSILVTVVPVNDAPVVSGIPDVTFAEDGIDSSIDLDNYVSDVDNADSDMFWTFSGNDHVHVSIDSNNIVTFTADVDWNGQETIIFTAEDLDGLSDSDSMLVTVTPVNDAPVVCVPHVTFEEDGSATLNLDTCVSDVDNDADDMTWTYTGNTNVHVSISSSRVAIFTAVQDWNGQEILTFTANDGDGGSDSDDFIVTVTPVNDAPVVSGIPDITMVEDDSDSSIDLDDYVSDVDNTDAEMTWTYSGNSNIAVSIDSNNLVTLIPAADWTGSETITFTATDSGSLSDSDTMRVIVTPINDAPDVSGLPDISFDEDGSNTGLDLDAYVSDVDNSDDELAWTFSGNTHVHVSISSMSKVVTFTADADWNGQETITFTAQDPSGATGSDTMLVTVAPVNDAPIVEDLPDVSFNEDSSYTGLDLDDYVTDVDNADSDMSWTFSGNDHVHVSIDSNNIVTFTADADWNGQETLTFTAEDLDGLSDSDSMIVTVVPVNDDPIVCVPHVTFEEDGSATLNLDTCVSDVDNDADDMTWTYTGNTNVLVSIDSSRLATFTAVQDWNGQEILTFTANDGAGGSDSDDFIVTVTPVNDAPVVSNIPDVTMDEDTIDSSIDLDNYVSDVDNSDAEMTWIYSGNSDIAVSIDGNNVVTFTAPANWNGQETLTFTAADPDGLSDSDTMRVTVTPVNDDPVVSGIPDVSFPEDDSDSSIDLDNYVSDLDNLDSDMTWTFSGNTHVHVSIDSNNIVTFTADLDWNGQEILTFTANDGNGGSDSDSVVVTVTPVNDAPVVEDLPDISFNEDSSYTGLDLDDYVTDVDNSDSEMIWTYSGNTNIFVTIWADNVVTFTAAPNWHGSETITFTAEDPDGLSDSDTMTVTVKSVNDDPIICIPHITFEEDGSATLDLDSCVSDVDHAPSEMAWTYSGNTHVHVSIDTSRIATFTADADWNGQEILTFTATDPLGGSDSDDFIVTVFPVNDAPVVSNIPDVTIPEDGSDSSIDLDNYVSDVDNSDAEMTWVYSGNSDIAVSIDGNNVVTLTPLADWTGSETLTFTASDPDGLSDSDESVVTVVPVNDAPIMSDIPDVTFNEDESYTGLDLDLYVFDGDNSDSEMIWTYSGNTNVFVSIDIDNIVTFTAVADWNGQETLTFTVEDPDGSTDSDSILVTVLPVNDAPVVSGIPDVTFPEDGIDSSIDLDDYVSDVDNSDADMFWTFSGNDHVHVSIDSNNIVTFTADVDWNGQETIVFTAEDFGGLSDSDSMIVTVSPVNDDPIVCVPHVTFEEDGSATVNLDDCVTDVDNDADDMTWTYSGNTNVHVAIDTNRIATFTANADWNGQEILTFTANDGAGGSDSDDFIVTVTPVNDAPVVSNIPDVLILEDGSDNSIDLDDYVSDVDNTDAEMTWIYAGNSNIAVSIDSDNLVTLTPAADWTGSETITFTATDLGSLSDSDDSTVTVVPINDAPVVSNIPDVTFNEDESYTGLDLDDYVVDGDNDDSEMTWTYTGNNHVHLAIDADHVVTFTADENWNGQETVMFTVEDPDGSTASDEVIVTVVPVNDLPEVCVPHVSFEEDGSATVNLDTCVSDVDHNADEMAWTYTGNTNVLVSIDTNRIATFTATADWNGQEILTFTATDSDGGSDSDDFIVTVTPVNDAPVVDDIPNVVMAEDSSDSSIDLDEYVSDVDNTDSEMTWTYTGNTDVSISIDGNNVITFTTPADWNGQETITFTAADPDGLSDSDSMIVTVSAENDAPVVSGMPDVTFEEDGSYTGLDLDDYVTDAETPDSDIGWSWSGNSNVFISVDSDHVVTFTAAADWNGQETITFTGEDDWGASDSDTITVTVNPINDAPVVSDIPDITMEEDSSDSSIDLDNYVSDIDNELSEITWTYSGNSNVQVSIDSDNVVTFTSALNWNGQETITFTATDLGSLSDSDSMIVTVTDCNDGPVVSSIPDVTFNEDESYTGLDLDNYVTDTDNDDSELTWTYTGNSHVQISIDSNHVVTFTADADWNGQETVSFTAEDPDGLTSSDSMLVTVVPVNDAPVVSGLPDISFNDDESYTIDLDNYVSDIDNSDSEMTWTYAGNTNVVVSIDANNVATFTAPDFEGQETIVFTATDLGGLSDSDDMIVIVADGNHAPVLAPIGDLTVEELDDFYFDVDASDVDGDVLTFSDNTDLFDIDPVTGEFEFTPVFGDSGVYYVTVTVSDGSLSDSETFKITIYKCDFPPTVEITHPLDGAYLTAGLSTDFIALGEDVNGDDLTYTWDFGDGTSANGRHTPKIFDNPGEYTVSVTASDGALSDTDSISVTLFPHGYNVTMLDSYEDDQFSVQESIFYRGEDLYVKFNVIKKGTGELVPNNIEYVYIYNNETGLGNTELDPYNGLVGSENIIDGQADTPDGTYYYYMPMIPLSDDNLGWNIVFVFSYDGVEAGQATLPIQILNNELVLDALPDISFPEDGSDNSLDLDDYVWDLETPDDEIEWTYSGNNHVHVSINQDNVVTFTADSLWNGQETLSFTADDTDGSTESDSILVAVGPVNNAPVLAPIGDHFLEELDDFYFDVDASDVDGDVLTFSDNTDLFDIDPVTGEIEFTPQFGDSGVYEVTVTVSDGSLSDSETFTITIYKCNLAPEVEITHPLDGALLTAGLTTDFIALATDGNGDDLSYTWDFGDGTSATDRHTPKVYENPGEYTVSVTATDGALSDSDSITVTLFPHGYNVTLLDSYEDDQFSVQQSIFYRGEDLYVKFSVIRKGTGELVANNIEHVYIYNNETGLGNTELDPYNGMVEGELVVDGQEQTPDGTYYYYMPMIPLSDDNLGWNMVFVFSYDGVEAGQAVLPIQILNNELVLDELPDISFPEDGSDNSLDLDDYVWDLETPDDEMLWSYSGNNHVHLSIGSDNVVTFTADPLWNGQEIVSFTADDTDGSTDSDSILVTVGPVNNAPVLAPIGDLFLEETDDFYFDVDASDVDGDTLTFSDNTDLFDIDPVTGEFEFTPAFGDSGVYTVTVTVSDGLLSDSETFKITIYKCNLAPEVWITHPLDGALLTAGLTTDFIALGSDGNGDELTYTWDFGDGTSATDRHTPKIFDNPGEYTVSVTASDGALSDTDSISVTLFPHGYNVTLLDSYEDDQFSVQQSIFYRGEDLYVKFSVIRKGTGELVANNIEHVYIYNNETGLGNTELDPYNGLVGSENIIDGQADTPDGTYYYYMPMIPLSDDNLGWNMVFVFSYDGVEAGQAVLPIQILNNELVLDELPDVSFDEDESDSSLDLDDYVWDLETPDDEMLWTYSGNNHVHLSIGSNNVVTFTADANWYGQETVMFTADDTDGSTDSDSILVSVGPVSDGPVISNIPDITMYENIAYSGIDLDHYVTDADHADSELTWTYSGNNRIDVSIDADNLVTFTPDHNWFGIETIIFTVEDPTGLSDSDATRVTVISVNEAPLAEFYPAGDVTLDQYNDQYFYIVASDPDGDSLSYEWYLDGSLVSTSDDYTFNGDVDGDYTLYAEVSDGEFTLSNTWQITVLPYEIDLSNACGKIEFHSNDIELSRFAADPSLLDEGVFISCYPMSAVNVEDLYEFENEPATITMYNVPENFILYHNRHFYTENPNEVTNPCSSDVCSNVEYDASTGTVTFDVPNFGVYKAQAPTALRNKTRERTPDANIKMIKAKPASIIVKPGSYVEMLVGLENVGELDAEDVVITISNRDLGIKQKYSAFDLDSGDRDSIFVALWLDEDVKAGEYYFHISASGSNDRRAKYVPIYVY